VEHSKCSSSIYWRFKEILIVILALVHFDQCIFYMGSEMCLKGNHGAQRIGYYQ